MSKRFVGRQERDQILSNITAQAKELDLPQLLQALEWIQEVVAEKKSELQDRASRSSSGAWQDLKRTAGVTDAELERALSGLSTGT